MSDKIATAHNHALTIPAFGKSPALTLDMGKIREAEERLVEAKTVNPVTYADLEHSFNEAYRDLKRHLASLGFQITQAEKAIQDAKANVLLDTYPAYLEANGIKKTQDNSDLRNAFMSRDPAYNAALDRLNQLKAMEAMMDGKIKVIENTCRYICLLYTSPSPRD